MIDEPSSQPDSPRSPTKPGATTTTHGSKSSLAILTLAGIVTVYAHSGSISVVALGLSNAILQVLAFHLVERARGAAHHLQNGDSVIYSANGLLTQPVKPQGSSTAQWMSLLRDVSAAAALTTGLAAASLESRRFGGLGYYGILGQIMGQHWVFGQGALSVLFGIVTLLVHIVLFGALVLMVSLCSGRDRHLPNSHTGTKRAFSRSLPSLLLLASTSLTQRAARKQVTDLLADSSPGRFRHQLRAPRRSGLLAITRRLLTLSLLVRCSLCCCNNSLLR